MTAGDPAVTRQTARSALVSSPAETAEATPSLSVTLFLRSIVFLTRPCREGSIVLLQPRRQRLRGAGEQAIMHLDEDTMKNLFLNPALKLIMAMALSGAMVITSVGRLPAVEPANEKQGLRKGPLANLPSPPGPHIEKIKALGDNEWVDLGSPSPDPKCGRATGRSWGAKMPYAADLGGAFLMGTGPHGFVKPNGYTDDDLWFLDLNAFRWICLWPGLNTKTFSQQAQQGEFKLNSEGQFVDSQERLIPAESIGHAWGNVTYDPDQRRFA